MMVGNMDYLVDYAAQCELNTKFASIAVDDLRLGEGAVPPCPIRRS